MYLTIINAHNLTSFMKQTLFKEKNEEKKKDCRFVGECFCVSLMMQSSFSILF